MVSLTSSRAATDDRSAGDGDSAQRRPWSATPVPLRRRERSAADLARVIESEIIPRLTLAGAPLAARAPAEPQVAPRTLDTFVAMTSASETHTLVAYVEALIQRGLSMEGVYVDLLIPAARRLGDAWDDDRISFADVTIGLGRLQQVVRGLGAAHPAHDAGPDARSACFVSAPGEQHTFGLFVLEDQFRRAGWRTWLDAAATQEDAAGAVSRSWFDVFGVSATTDVPPERIRALVARVRRASRNPHLFVLAGGGLFTADPALAGSVGADAMAASVGDALSLADMAVKPSAFG